jgi:hypothetical protein
VPSCEVQPMLLMLQRHGHWRSRQHQRHRAAAILLVSQRRRLPLLRVRYHVR